MARVGLDIDSVLFPFPQLFRQYAIDTGWLVADVSYPTTWAFYESYGWTREQFLLVHEEFVKDFGYQSGPVIGGRETLDALMRLGAAGHSIILVTARHTTPAQRMAIEVQTRQWLVDSHVPFDELHFERDKTRVPVDYFLDDRFENFVSLGQAGVDSFLLDQPWNRHRAAPDNVVKSVAEYVDEVLEEQVGTEVREGDLIGESGGGRVVCAHMEAPSKGVSDEVRITSETGGQKGKKLAELGSVDPLALWEVARVSGFGAQKYAAFNFLKGYDHSLSYNALQRHLMLYWAGTDRDEESGELHLAHAAWHCLALIAFHLRGVGTDDRPPHKAVSDV